MSPFWRRILGLGALALFAGVWLVSSRLAAASRRSRTCQGVKVEVTDSLLRRFVAPEDVKAWMKDYGVYVGLPLDSVNLDRIEKIMDGKGAVRSSQAYLTDDGYIHIRLTQREPVVRFQDGTNGYYADESGYVFPLQSRFAVRVPVVDGEIPLNIERGFKGDLSSDPWLMKVLSLTRWMKGSVWEENISQIRVGHKGELTFYPREGKERFLFGQPERFEEKFRLMARYYESIVPSRENEGYRVVDLRYRGQIVCRQK